MCAERLGASHIRSMYYQPKLSNGKLVPFFWPVRVARRLNHVFWPLEDWASAWMRAFDRAALLLGFAVFQYYNEAELRYLWENLNNVDLVLSGVPTYVVLVETMFRGFYIGWSKHRLQQLLKRFYAEIYVEEKLEQKAFQQIDQLLLPTKFYNVLYMCALTSVASFPIIRGLVVASKEPLYKMSFTYDITPNYIFIPLTIAGVYVGIIVTTAIVAEGYILATSVFHLNARYLLLRRDLNARIELLLRKGAVDCIAKELRLELVEVVKRNNQLMDFTKQMQQEFTRRIFINLLFSGILLCALSFKTYTNPTESIGFVFWMMAKLVEMLSMGHVGSTIRDTTDQTSAMYYECGWERVIARSTDCRENVAAMKVVLTAMELNQAPIILSGLGFFTLSLDAILVMLKAAGSLFSCLIAVR